LSTITISPLTARIGAEIDGVDLRAPLSDPQIHEIHHALIEHQVIFFRDQPIDIATQVAFGRRFGTLHLHTGVPGLSEEFPEVTRIHADADSTGINGEEWHSDLSCDVVPPMGSILHIHTLPPAGGDTIFASMYAAYEALSPNMRHYLEGLTATHDGVLAFGKYGRDKKYPVSSHPVIKTHPVSGRKVIYVNRGFTSHINELPRDESSAVLSYLFAHAAKPEFQVRFRWRKHSIAFWDNRCTQHIAIWDYFPHVRSGYRVQIDTEGLN